MTDNITIIHTRRNDDKIITDLARGNLTLRDNHVIDIRHNICLMEYEQLRLVYVALNIFTRLFPSVNSMTIIRGVGNVVIDHGGLLTRDDALKICDMNIPIMHNSQCLHMVSEDGCILVSSLEIDCGLNLKMTNDLYEFFNGDYDILDTGGRLYILPLNYENSILDTLTRRIIVISDHSHMIVNIQEDAIDVCRDEWHNLIHEKFQSHQNVHSVGLFHDYRIKSSIIDDIDSMWNQTL